MSTARDLAAEFRATADKLRSDTRGIVSTYSDLGVTKTKAAASSFTHSSRTGRSGRASFPDPHVGGYQGEGPNVRTGDYRRSIGPAEVREEGGVIVGTWGTNAPQGPRLEYGFDGVDSLGRSYSQGPLPHHFPAAEWAQAQIEAALDRLVASL